VWKIPLLHTPTSQEASSNVVLSIPSPSLPCPVLERAGVGCRLCWQCSWGRCVLVHFWGISAGLASALICLGMALPI
uniref:Uncharacterized protein n=1 Tax=Geospiza parvula TaxID=87175 RepID=A0A8C3QB10_GEOPR